MKTGVVISHFGPLSVDVIDSGNDLQDGRLRRLFGQWHDLHRDGAPPGRSFVDPLTLRFVLGSLLLFDVDAANLRFRYRLVGTEVVDHLGLELTGLWLRDHPDRDRAEYIEQALQLSWATQKAVRFRYSLHVFDQNWPCESLVLPISRRDEERPVILAGQIFPDAMPRWRRAEVPPEEWQRH